MTDLERQTILEILGHRRHIAGQKCILLALMLHPEGLSLYDLMDILQNGKAYRNRRAVQRLLEYLLATGAVYDDKTYTGHGPKDGRKSKNYRIGVKS